ncbi:MAG: hypothetical protein M3542_07730 [Acidobacteriota bacterium]|nr:hypothetical protein [Acidobacteriota bacterium]
MKVLGSFLLLGLLAAVPSPVTRVDPPARPGALGPNLSLDGKAVLLSWLEPPHPGVKPQEGNYALRFSRLENGRWSEPATIASGTDFFANWADFPSVTPDARGRLLAHWAAKSAGETYAYDVRLALSRDRGRTWKPLGTAHDDRTPTEHGFVSAVPEGDRVRLFWLDGRATAGGRGAMALRTALVGDAVGRSEVLDRKVCDCCQTGAAATAGGPLVVYRDRSDTEIRDVAAVRVNGNRWTAPRPVARDGWEIGGCPVNGPAIAAAGRRVAVAWYTQAADRPRVEVAFSNDAGASFGPVAVVDARAPLGRVDVVLDGNGDALVLWAASEGKAGSIRLARVTPAGRVGPALSVAATDASRSSGFPRLERADDTLVVAWIEASEPPRLRAATIPAREVR